LALSTAGAWVMRIASSPGMTLLLLIPRLLHSPI
jgi:hypothetical protein